MDRRSYNQYCGLAKALDVVGERWTLLIVRNLLLGPMRYSEFLRGLPGITTNLLAKRLKEMEELGLIERVRGSAADGGHAYRLTPLGAGLEPAIHALSNWAFPRLAESRRGEFRSMDFLLIALRRRYRGGESLRAEIVADQVPYRITLTPTGAEVLRGAATSPDIRVTGPGAAIARLFLDADARRNVPASIEVEGGSATLRRLLRAFSTEELAFGWAAGAPLTETAMEAL